MERVMQYGRTNIQGIIERGAVVLHKIDLGAETGEGVGLAIINIFARMAQELHRPFAITRTCNMGLVRALEKVTDFRFNDIAHDIFSKQAEVGPDRQAHEEILGEAGIHVAASRIIRPNIVFEWRMGGYWLSDDRSALISFALDSEGGLKLYKNLPFRVKGYTPDIPMGAGFRGITFNPDGTLLYEGRNIGYSLALNFQLSRISGKKPKPVEGLMVEV